ncbi:hypothetical protein [Pseudomonas oryzihabitans]|uniref:hypothetical protein n=1 Tax=Pseudomonas oryzihabitans TaxID=47885 RepID=UPI002894DD7F|nr:hypothetical protein [Pseudomonas oryzihabitans]MDT3718427.1 hypothetical protein [Pseudomonas oryzihabitans]
MWARIENDRVAETTTENPKGRFHESLVWVLCRNTVKIGDLYDGTAFSAEPVSQEMLQASFETAIQAHLDGAARARGYDSISTAISYAEEPAVPKFQDDGKAFRAWRSLVWAYAYQELAKVKAGEREIPALDAFMAELPALAEPSTT